MFTRSGVRPGFPISAFLFNLVIVMVMETVLFSCECNGTDIRSDRNPSDSEKADDVVLPSEDPSKLRAFS